MNASYIASHVSKAAEIFGSEAALARALGVSRGALNQWKKTGREVPAEHAPHIEFLTGVRCELLCPSVDWGLIRKQGYQCVNEPSDELGIPASSSEASHA